MTSTEDITGRRRVEEAARAAVTELGPDEKDLFPLAAEVFFAEGRLPARRRVDDRLGVGVDLTDVVITISPVALMIASEAAKALVGEATKASMKAVGRRTAAAWRARAERRRAAAQAAETTETGDAAPPEHLTDRAGLRTRLIARAVEQDLSADDAARLVDVVLAELDGHDA